MHVDTVKAALHATPFQPFIVRTVNGASYLVDHPVYAMVSRSGRTVRISLPGGEGESVCTLDTALIERLESAGTTT